MTERSTKEVIKVKYGNSNVFAIVASALFISLIPSWSQAYGGDGGIGETLCIVVNWFSGPVGSAIASLAVIFLGISAFFGKVNWGMALLFASGIFAIFGAEQIVAAITPSGFIGCGGGGGGGPDGITFTGTATIPLP